MTTSLSQECLVYPGEYIPMPETNALLQQQVSVTSANPVPPAMNMNEGPESFSFEMIIPGIKRENIIVHLDGKILSILVIPWQRSGQVYEKQLVHEFEEGRMERHIVMPENADMEFVSAEYKMGVLKICIPKSAETTHPSSRYIVVY